MAENVTRLMPCEHVSLDPLQVRICHPDLAPEDAEDLFEGARVEIGLLHLRMGEQYAAYDFANYARNLRRLSRLTATLGNRKLLRATRHVQDCLDRADSTGLAATWARLSRLAHQASGEAMTT